MDRDFGSKPGSGGAASAQNEAIDRRERLRRLALETIDLAKDPYFMRNHLGRCVARNRALRKFAYAHDCGVKLNAPAEIIGQWAKNKSKLLGP